jgi:hypothetical protein
LSIRQYLNKNPLVAAGFTVVAIVFVILMLFYQMRSDSSVVASRPLPRMFYTVDDGKTYFPETIDKVPPFTTSDNKTAYRAWVVKCKSGEPFVAYVEKYGDGEKKRLDGLFGDPNKRAVAIEAVMSPQVPTTLIKKPGTGDSGWLTPRDGAKYDAVFQPTCPEGGVPTPFFPQR